jgi:hypothetical protein
MDIINKNTKFSLDEKNKSRAIMICICIFIILTCLLIYAGINPQAYALGAGIYGIFRYIIGGIKDGF